MILDGIFGLEQRSRMVITGAGVGQDSTLNEVFGPRGETHAGVAVTEETPMTVSAWYAAVKLLAWSTAFLPLFVYQREKNGDREPAPSHPLYTLLHDRPNADMNSMIYRELGVIYVLLWGNSYSWIERNGAGTPTALWPLHPRDVQVKRARDRSLFYDISRLEDPPTSREFLFPDEVLHVPGLGFDGITGRSIVSFASEQVGESVAAQQFASGFYASGAQTNIAITHPGKLKDPDRLRGMWLKKHAKPGSGPAVLDEGMDVKQIGMPLADAQYIESRQFMVTDAARWTGLPPHKLADLLRATFSNIAEQNIEFVQALLPWMHRFEQEYNWKLFTIEQRVLFFVEHVPDGLLAADPEKRANSISTGLQNGYLTRNEARRLLNLNSMGPSGDVFTVQVNLQDIERLGDEPAEPDPIVDETPPDTPEDEPEEPSDDQRSMLVGTVRGTLRAALVRLIVKEAQEARSAAARPAEFVTWLDKFYRRSYPPKVEIGITPACEALRALGVEIDPTKTARELCDRSRAALLDLAGRSTAGNLADHIETEVTGWEQSLAGTLTDNLFSEVQDG